MDFSSLRAKLRETLGDVLGTDLEEKTDKIDGGASQIITYSAKRASKRSLMRLRSRFVTRSATSSAIRPPPAAPGAPAMRSPTFSPIDNKCR
jgi:hypothetical protein